MMRTTDRSKPASSIGSAGAAAAAGAGAAGFGAGVFTAGGFEAGGFGAAGRAGGAAAAGAAATAATKTRRSAPCCRVRFIRRILRDEAPPEKRGNRAKVMASLHNLSWRHSV